MEVREKPPLLLFRWSHWETEHMRGPLIWRQRPCAPANLIRQEFPYFLSDNCPCHPARTAHFSQPLLHYGGLSGCAVFGMSWTRTNGWPPSDLPIWGDVFLVSLAGWAPKLAYWRNPKAFLPVKISCIPEAKLTHTPRLIGSAVRRSTTSQCLLRLKSRRMRPPPPSSLVNGLFWGNARSPLSRGPNDGLLRRSAG